MTLAHGEGVARYDELLVVGVLLVVLVLAVLQVRWTARHRSRAGGEDVSDLAQDPGRRPP